VSVKGLTSSEDQKKNLLSSKWFNLLQAFILRFYKTYGRRIKNIW